MPNIALQQSNYMKSVLFSLIGIITFVSFNYQNPTIKASELKLWLGNYKGTLTYKDYSSGNTVNINATIKLGPIVEGSKIAVKEGYPDEPDHNSIDTLRFSADGNSINYMKLVSKKKSADGFQFVLETQGEDDGQKADLRITYNFSKTRFTRKKEVRHRGETEYFVRNEYKMVRH
jgi:hypothetical protein